MRATFSERRGNDSAETVGAKLAASGISTGTELNSLYHWYCAQIAVRLGSTDASGSIEVGKRRTALRDAAKMSR